MGSTTSVRGRGTSGSRRFAAATRSALRPPICPNYATISATLFNLSVWTDLGPTIVRWDTGWHTLSITFKVGSVLPLLESSVGRVFLTFLPTEQTRAVLASQQEKQETQRLPKAEVNAITREVAKTKIAYTERALVPALSALAAPVLGADSELLMVAGVAFPSRLGDKKTIARLTGRLRAVVGEISIGLGYAAPS